MVAGDPDKEGEPFVIRIQGKDGAKVPPHWHPTDENVTVLRGTFLVGMGDHYDEAKLQGHARWRLRSGRQGDAALRQGQGRDRGPGSWHGAVQGELGEPVGGRSRSPQMSACRVLN